MIISTLKMVISYNIKNFFEACKEKLKEKNVRDVKLIVFLIKLVKILQKQTKFRYR